MSRGSEYASAVGNLYQLQAENQARRAEAQANAKLQKAAIWSGTLSSLGQMVANLPQAMRERKIAGLQEQELLEGFQDRQAARQAMGQIRQIVQEEGGINERSVQRVGAIDPTVAKRFQQILDDADARAKRVRDQGMADDRLRQEILASTNPTDPQSVMVNMTRYQRAFPDEDASIFQSEDLAGFVKAANEALRTPQQRYESANPPPPEMVGIPTVQDGVPGILRRPANEPGFVPGIPPPPPAPGPLVPMTGPNGPIYGTREQAIGQPVPQTPQAPRDERIVQIMRNGVPVWVKESEAIGQPAAQAARAVTGAERQALAFYNRGREALDTLTIPNERGKSLEDRIAESNLLQQTRGQIAPNALQTTDQQQYRQAQRAFTEARLRKESGAAIPPQEYLNDARTYFFQPNDSPRTIAQKRAARQTVLDGLGYAAGKAYDEFYGEPFLKPTTLGGAPATPQTPATKPTTIQSGPWTATEAP